MENLDPPVLLSVTRTDDKKATHSFHITQIKSLVELINVMNTNAVCSGLFIGGHRHSRNLKSMGRVYLIDIDLKPENNNDFFYQEIEKKLINKNITYVSVPSKSADKQPWKRHIAFNNISFLAPASINSKFKNYTEQSSYFIGDAFQIPKKYQAKKRDANAENMLNSNDLIEFSDGSKMSSYMAKQIIPLGTSKSCYCPNLNHQDKNPSATFYHNQNGTSQIFCGKCGLIKIKRSFILPPILQHSQYKYNISVGYDQEKNRELKKLLGEPSIISSDRLIWYFSINNMSDIYQLFLAKSFLIDGGYKLIEENNKIDPSIKNCDIDILQCITKNHMLPNIYIPTKKTAEMTPDTYVYFTMRSYIYQYSYLLPEASIFTIYQNRIDPYRNFEDTCNMGLGYYEYIIKIQNEQKNLKQKDKKFPMKLSQEQKKQSYIKRAKKAINTKTEKITNQQKNIKKLIKSKEFIKPNGKVNKTKLSNYLKISRPTLNKYLQNLSS